METKTPTETSAKSSTVVPKSPIDVIQPPKQNLSILEFLEFILSLGFIKDFKLVETCAITYHPITVRQYTRAVYEVIQHIQEQIKIPEIRVQISGVIYTNKELEDKFFKRLNVFIQTELTTKSAVTSRGYNVTPYPNKVAEKVLPILIEYKKSMKKYYSIIIRELRQERDAELFKPGGELFKEAKAHFKGLQGKSESQGSSDSFSTGE